MITILLKITETNETHDIVIAEDTSVMELLVAIASKYNLKIDFSDLTQCYLKFENPIRLLRANQILGECGIHDGSIINFTQR